MKKLLILILTLLSFSVYSQEIINDDNFEKKISSRSAFSDEGESTVVVEFWASFNSDNEFKEFKKLDGVTFYRCDIAKSPSSKKKYSIKTIPTIVIYKNGIEEVKFKAGIGFTLSVTLEELQESIDELLKESKF